MELPTSKLCKYCHKPLSNKSNTFCSHSCAASFNNKGIRRHGQKRICPECGKVAKVKFCSKECFTLSQHKLSKQKVMEGEIVTPRTLRNILLRERKYQCDCCKLTQWNELPISLEVHHIDGNSENNSFENLQLLCPNCHSQTPNYGTKNFGNGREFRRQRYKEGKSR